MSELLRCRDCGLSMGEILALPPWEKTGCYPHRFNGTARNIHEARRLLRATEPPTPERTHHCPHCKATWLAGRRMEDCPRCGGTLPAIKGNRSENA